MSENLWDLKILWEVAFRGAKFCDFISQCEVWHVWKQSIYKELKSIGYFLKSRPPDKSV